MKSITHSVTLDAQKCQGCTTCVKRCPTEAIRVRNAKAIIIKERCIDCGECIRVCPHHAKKAVVDTLDILQQFDYTIALPAPTLYAQFRAVWDRNITLTALKTLGFDDVFEVSAAAEAISEATYRDLKQKKLPEPVISTACPTIVRIIRVRFPSLLPLLLDYRAPMELAARWAKKLAVKKTGLPEDRIGCIFISPCPAKATASRMPLGTVKSAVDGVVSIAEVYPFLRNAIKEVKEPEPLARSGPVGVGWAVSGGESAGAGVFDFLAADGMENVIRVLEALEDDKIHHVSFIELNACVGGCVGGVLTVENSFIAKARLTRVMAQAAPALAFEDLPESDMHWDEEVQYSPVLQLDSDVQSAMDKLNRIKELEQKFNGMDCGACGTPSCHALAEDIVLGYAKEDQCIFLIREKLQKLLAEQGGSSAEEEAQK